MDDRGDAALVCVLENDYPVTVVRAAGAMSVASVPALRRVVQKAFTDHPALLLIDVSALEVIDDVTVTAFAALARQGAVADVPVMLVAPAPGLDEQLNALGINHSVPIYASEESARTAVAALPGSWLLQADLDPVPSATVTAREMADQACTQWRLRELADMVSLVATELVANAVQHAGTRITFALSRRPSYLHIGCRDRSHAVPRRGGDDTDSRGLMIVESIASGWGFTPTLDGKVVWATVRSRR
jgi:anti-anti-sigma factor